jgi:GntR family transcriptional regulator, transcriptional repressor for pyruvate dehydrogenase complex
MERAKELRDFNEDTFEQHAAIVDALEAKDRIHYQYALVSHLELGLWAFEEETRPA